MSNLLTETLEILNENGKTVDDIKWIGTYTAEISIRTFLEYADQEYDNGYGTPEVNMSLVVVGDDWWLERGEYDGSEWWEFKTKPKRPKSIETREAHQEIFR